MVCGIFFFFFLNKIKCQKAVTLGGIFLRNDQWNKGLVTLEQLWEGCKYEINNAFARSSGGISWLIGWREVACVVLCFDLYNGRHFW